MRPATIATASLVVALTACASRPAPTTAQAELNCPSQLLATVSNRRNVGYDVLYQEGQRPATVVGEVAAGSTQTFTLPNEGRGRVFLKGQTGGGYVIPRPGNPQRDIDIRLHCAG